jgi:hypothetical protein
MSDKIFFSYSRFDSAFVLKLASDLRNAGATIWLDQLDIPPGKHWDTEIEGALHNANCLIAVLSPKSLNSDNVMDEISYALEEKKKVIPVLLTDTGTPFRLRRLQRVDFTGDYETGFKQLLKSINIETPVVKAPDQLPVKQAGDETSTIAALVQEKEDYMWERCCYLDTIPAYQEYLRKTTLRQHVDEAWAKITALEEATGVQTRHAFPGRNPTANAKKKYSLLAAGIILLAGLAWGAYKIFSPREEEALSAQEKTTPATGVINHEQDTTSSSTTPPVNEARLSGESAPTSVPSEKVIKKETDKPQTPTKKTREVKNEAENKDQRHSSKDSTPDRSTFAENTAAVNTHAPAVPPPEQASGLVTINSKVVVYLALLDAVDLNQKKKSPQKVRFSVTSPVQYRGHTIIRQGAVAYGTITVGSRLTDLAIDEVMAANGKMISLRSESNRGKVKDLENRKTFTAIVKEGTYQF